MTLRQRSRRRNAGRAAPDPAAPRVSPRGRLGEFGLAVLVLAAALTLAYGNVIFGGASLVYSNNTNPLDHRFTAENYGPGFLPAAVWETRNLLTSANFHDAGGPAWQWEPSAVFLRNALADGEWPWWNPYNAAGTPEMANLVGTLFFPPYLVMVLAGNTVGLRNLYALMFLLSAGVCTHLFLRAHGLRRVACVLGALAFVFCGALTQNVGSFHGQTLACLPVALLLTSWFFERPNWRRVAALAAGFGAVALSSFPPVLIGVFGVVLCYAIARSFYGAGAGAALGQRVRLYRRFAVATVLAVGLVAAYYLPAFALLGDAPTTQRAYAGAGFQKLAPVCLLQLLSPTLMGGAEVFARPPMPEPYGIHLSYVGVVPLLAALLIGIGDDPRRRALAATTLAAGGLVLFKLFGVPPVQWLAHLPFLEHIHFAHYLGGVLAFLVAVAAALGTDRLVRGRVGAVQAVVAAGLVLAALLITRVVAAEHGALRHAAAGYWFGDYRVRVVACLLAAVVVLVAVLLRQRPAVGLAGGSLVLLLLLEAVPTTSYPRQQRWEVWRNPPDYVAALRRLVGQGRVFTAGALTANSGAAFEVLQLDSMMALNPPRVFELYRRYAAPRAFSFLREASQLPPESVLDRAAIELVAVRQEMPAFLRLAEDRPYQVAHEGPYVRVFRRQSTPRYYFTTEYRVIADRRAALEAIGTMPVGRELVLEQPVEVRPAPNQPSDPQVEVVEFRRNRYVLKVTAPRAGLVYMADSFFPGWAARVNGLDTSILPANYAFRAVAVPLGAATIELSYWPPGLTSGLWITAVSLLVAVALAIGLPRARAPGRSAAA